MLAVLRMDRIAAARRRPYLLSVRTCRVTSLLYLQGRLARRFYYYKQIPAITEKEGKGHEDSVQTM